MTERYTSVTDWHAEPFIVRVCAGSFKSAREAAAFGNQEMRLVRAGKCLVLSSVIGGRELAVVADESVRVWRLKPEASRSGIAYDEDFDPVEIPIANFEQDLRLHSFGSLAYGVRRVA